jgi:uncharacterized membrane protein HdeD (DUF308 family)
MRKEFDKAFKTAILSWIIFIILGIFLFLKAELTLKIISYVVGGTLLLAIFPLVKTLLSREVTYFSYSFISEIFMVTAGIIIILNPNLIASIIPILIGIIMIVNGVSKFQFAVILREQDVKSWLFTLLLSILIIALGILFLVNPFQGAVAITKAIGILIIVYSIIDMIDFCIIHKDIKKFNDTVDTVLNEKAVKIIEEEE